MVKKKLARLLTDGFLFLLLAFMLLPVAMAVLCSVGVGEGTGLSFAGYADFYIRKPRYLNAFMRSFWLSAAVTAGSLTVSVPAAFAFAKAEFRGKPFLFVVYVIVMILPFQVTLLPQYMLSKSLGTYDTLSALIVPGIFSCFPVFLLTQITKTLNGEIIEAAQLDTSNMFRILWSVVIPNIRSGIVCTAVLVFAEQWNLVAEPLVLLETEERFPLAVILNSFSERSLYAFAAVVIFLVPPLFLFLLFEDELMEGLGEYRLK